MATALLARAGASFSSLFDVHTDCASATSQAGMSSHRQHFVRHLELAVIGFSALQMAHDSGLDVMGTTLTFRPHHIAEDSRATTEVIRRAFDQLAAKHTCPLLENARSLSLTASGVCRLLYATSAYAAR